MINSIYEEERISTIAARYRLSLDNQNEIDTNLLTPMYKNMVLSKILNNFEGFRIRADELMLSGNFNFFMKNLKTFSYSYFKNLEIYKRTINSNVIELYNESKKIEDFFQNQISNFESVKRNLAKEGSRFFVRNNFSQRNLEETYDLIDIKNKTYFTKNELCECDFKRIITKSKALRLLTPIRASILGSSESGQLVEKSNEISFLWRPKKRYKYIVYKEEKRLRYSESMEKASLNILYDFGFINKTNYMILDEGSFLPTVLNESKFKYYDAQSSSWRPIEIIYQNKKMKKNFIYFKEIETSKIQISIDQYRSLNKVSKNNLTAEEKFDLEVIRPNNNEISKFEMYDIYDLSLDELSFYYIKYRRKGLYRDSKYLEVDKLKFISLKDESVEVTNSLIEAEVEIQYYQEDSWNWIILPLPRSYKVKEVLSVKNKQAILTFPIKEDGEIIISNENGETLNSPFNFFLYTIRSLEEDQSKIYNHYIDFNDNFRAAKIIVEYEIPGEIKYPVGVYKNNILQFDGEIKDKKALVRSRYIIRNLGTKSNSSVITKAILESNAKDDFSNVSNRYRILKGN